MYFPFSKWSFEERGFWAALVNQHFAGFEFFRPIDAELDVLRDGLLGDHNGFVKAFTRKNGQRGIPEAKVV